LNQGIIPAHAPLDLTEEQIETITEEFY